MAFGAQSIGTLFARIGLDTNPLKLGVADANRTFRGLGTTGASAARALSPLGPQFAAIGGAAATAAVAIGTLKSTISVGTEFQRQMVMTGAVARATDEELQQLTETAKFYGETTEYTSSQAAKALEFLGLAGFKVAESTKALPGVLNLATAAQIDLGRSADIAASALRGFQLPVEQLARVNDVLVGTFTRSNTDLEQLSEAMKYVAPVANAFGYSIEQTAAALGLLGNAGIKGSMAGTQMRFAFQRAAEAADDWGSKNKDLLSVLSAMNDKGASALDFMKTFGQRGGLAALILSKQIQGWNEFGATLTTVGGETDDLAEKVRGTLWGAFKALQSILERTKIDILDTFQVQLRDGVNAATNFLRANREQFVQFFGAMASGMLTLGQISANVLSGISKGFADTWNDATKRTQDGFTDMSQFPADFVDVIAGMFQIVGAVAAGIMKIIVLFFQTVVKNFQDVVKTFQSTASGLAKAISGDWSGAAKDFEDAWEHAKNYGYKNIVDFWEKGSKAGQAAVDGMTASFNQMLDKMANRRFPVQKTDFVGPTMPKGGFGLTEDEIQKIIDDWQKQFGDGGEAVGDEAGSKMATAMKRHGQDVTNYANEMSSEIAKAYDYAGQKISDTFFAGLKGDWQGALDVMKSLFDDFLRFVANQAVQQLGVSNANWVQGLASLFGLGGGGAPAGGGGGGAMDFLNILQPMAAGGLVTGPTPAIVGESGPELVMPLDRMNDKSIARRLGFEGMGGGGKTIHQTNKFEIHATDGPSVMRSANQIMARMALASRMAAERNN